MPDRWSLSRTPNATDLGETGLGTSRTGREVCVDYCKFCGDHLVRHRFVATHVRSHLIYAQTNATDGPSVAETICRHSHELAKTL